MKRTLAAALAIAGTFLLRAPATAQAPSVTTRAFTLTADAFPVSAAPGNNGTVIAVSPAAVQLSLTNPPGASYARAATVDTSALEQFTGPPPANTVAECSTETANINKHAQATPDGMTLNAHCDDSPAATATAAASDLSAGGMTAASVVSVVKGGPAGDALKATADVLIRDGVLGPLKFGVAHYAATIASTGELGGAVARATLTVADAAFAGIPVVLASDGIQVDQSRVPLDLVQQVTEQLHRTILSSQYHDIRLVQPRATTSSDGSTATVSGGGIEVFLTNANPAGTYFVGTTILGGSLSGQVGEPLSLPLPTVVSPVSPPLTSLPSTVISPPHGGPVPPPLVQAVSPTFAASRARAALPVRWVGLPWALGAIGLLALLWIARGPQIARRLDAVAERYLRG